MVDKKSPQLSPLSRITLGLNREGQGLFGPFLGRFTNKKYSGSEPKNRLPGVTPKKRGRLGKFFSRLAK
jgi:hypothetical protein